MSNDAGMLLTTLPSSHLLHCTAVYISVVNATCYNCSFFFLQLPQNMMSMNMPLVRDKVTFRATLFGLVKTALSIGCPGESLSLLSVLHNYNVPVVHMHTLTLTM